MFKEEDEDDDEDSDYEIEGMLIQGPLLLNGLLGAEMTSFLKIDFFFKSSFWVSVVCIKLFPRCSFFLLSTMQLERLGAGSCKG